MTDIVALDLFAGTGWGVACKWLGIEEAGVDNMPEVIDTRAANDMETIFHDVWAGLHVSTVDSETNDIPETLSARAVHVLSTYTLLIASPPCQTFSQAGSGLGRKALDQVIAAVREGRYKDPDDLHKLGEETDPRTALVLTPLAYAYRDHPTFVVLEQVPPVLPVWEAVAVELRAIGYSVVTGIVNAEQFGVPQTRKRAILIARNDGVEAHLPVPTHSKYYNRNPKQLDEGVLPWVSMAEALGWGTTEKPSYTVTGGGRGTGGYEPFPTGARQGMAKAMEEGEWALRSNYGTNGDPAARGERPTDVPAPTLTSKADRNFWVEKSSQSVAGGPRAERPVDEPAFTVTQNSDRVKFEQRTWADSTPEEVLEDLQFAIERAEFDAVLEGRNLPEREAEHMWKWKETPSTTVAGDPRITAREHHYHGEQNSTSFRLELAEAEALQSYPPMVWRGTKGKQFLQLGNAVPPLLGRAILETLLED